MKKNMESEKTRVNHSVINLRTDFEDSNMSIDRLQNWNCQNFTELLNRPKNSILHGIKNRLSDPHMPFDLNLEKFSDLGSPRSYYSQKSTNSTKSNPKPLKVLLEENYSDYLSKIKQNYPDFKFNHYSKYSERVKSCNTFSYYSPADNLNNDTSYTYENPYEYKPSNKLQQLQLPKDFLNGEKDFKIEKSILERPRDEVEFLIRDYIEKSGKIELEVERILNNSTVIYNYIEHNMSLVPKVEYFLDKIQNYKQGKDKFKKFVLMNTNKLVLKESKKRNLQGMSSVLKHLNALKEINDKIHNLHTNESNIQQENELFNKGKEVIRMLKNNFGMNSLKILNDLEKELLNYNNKSSEKINEEFSKAFSLMLKSFFVFDINSEEDDTGDYVSLFLKIAKIQNFNFDLGKLDIPVDNLEYMSKKIKIQMLDKNNINTNPDLQKVKGIFDMLLKKDENIYNLDSSEIANTIHNVIQGPLSKIKKHLGETLSYIRENLSLILTSMTESFKLSNERRDKIFMLILIKLYLTLNDNFETFEKFIKKEYFNFESSLIEPVEQLFSDLIKNLRSEMSKSISLFLDNCLNQAVNQLNLDNFIVIYDIMMSICEDYFAKFGINKNVFFCKYENEFVFQFFETKDETLKEVFVKDDWNTVQALPPRIQNIIRFIFSTNFVELKLKDRESIREALSSIEKMEVVVEEKDSDKMLNEEIPSNNIPTPNSNPLPTPNSIPLIEVNETKFKVSASFLEIINFIFDTVKVFCLFDMSLCETIIYQFVKIIKFYIQFCKETVILGEGVKKGKLKSISQKEISLLCGNICVLESIIIQLIKNMSSNLMEEKQEIIIPSLNELLNISRKVHINCREKIKELFDATIDSSLVELSKLDFSKYPVLEKKEYNLYCSRFKSFKTLYNHMLNGFEKDEIIDIFNEHLNFYFEKLEKSLVSSANANKMESESSYKQFKSDMLFLKKTMKSFELIDTSPFKDKIDQIQNSILPAKMLKKKKTTNLTSSSKNVVTEE